MLQEIRTPKEVLTIGFQGTNDRGQSWFIAGPLTLEKVQTDTQEKEISAELEAYKSLYPSLKEKFIQISLKLNQNKKNGLSRGGIISTTNNVPIRDENGKFTGNKKR